MRELKEIHQSGTVSLENVPDELVNSRYMRGDFGIQIAEDGRVWICINGIAFIDALPKPHFLKLGMQVAKPDRIAPSFDCAIIFACIR